MAKLVQENAWWKDLPVTCDGCGRMYELEAEDDLSVTQTATPSNQSRGIQSDMKVSYWFDLSTVQGADTG